mgnify:CR=1 FL=1
MCKNPMTNNTGPKSASLVLKRQQCMLVTRVPESPKMMTFTGSETFASSAVYENISYKVVKDAENKG